MKQRTFHLHALSALHVGTGQSVGIVDLPIARSRATELPLVPGSGLKGVLRDDYYPMDDANRTTVFGPANLNDGGAHAGAIAVGDAHLLILPVRSLAGVVAFATCPFVLSRYARDTDPQKPATVSVAADKALVADGSELVMTNKVVLEDVDLTAESNSKAATDWATKIAERLYPDDRQKDWRDEFKKHFVILPDNVFSFLATTATEIRARIRINDETRVVDDGALWYEENLPAETVLWGVIGISKARDKSKKSEEEVSALLKAGESHLQIGGKHTVGRGLCRFVLSAAI